MTQGPGGSGPYGQKMHEHFPQRNNSNALETYNLYKFVLRLVVITNIMAGEHETMTSYMHHETPTS